MKLKTTTLPLLAAGLISCGLSLESATVVLGPDATMSTSDWSVAGTNNFDVTGITATLSNGPTFGNPGDGLKLDLDYTAGSQSNSWIAAFLTSSAFTYDPSASGELIDVSLSIDADITANTALSLVAVQDSVIYWTHLDSAARVVVSAADPYQNYDIASITSSSFAEVPNSSTGNTIDFSATGSELTFGIAWRRGEGGSGARSWDYFMDNAEFSLNTVPEVSHFGMLAGLTVFLFALRRRRK